MLPPLEDTARAAGSAGAITTAGMWTPVAAASADVVTDIAPDARSKSDAEIGIEQIELQADKQRSETMERITCLEQRIAQTTENLVSLETVDGVEENELKEVIAANQELLNGAKEQLRVTIRAKLNMAKARDLLHAGVHQRLPEGPEEGENQESETEGMIWPMQEVFFNTFSRVKRPILVCMLSRHVRPNRVRSWSLGVW